MPPKSKKRLAAEHREAKRAENDLATTSAKAYTPPRYTPLDPSLQPYWDAFYENPYPSTDERRALSERLNMSPKVIHEWFAMARRFTHAPDKNSDDYCGDLEALEVEVEDLDDEGTTIEGTLYEYFYRGVINRQSSTHSPLKRKWFDTEATAKDRGAMQAGKSDTVKPTATQYRGPRGMYTKQSQETLRRRAIHAHKYASPIQSFFPVISRAAKKPRVELSPCPDPPTIEHIIVAESEPESEPEIVTSGIGRESFVDRSSGEVVVSEVGQVATGSKFVEEDKLELESYHSALGLLELSMNRLKLSTRLSLEPQINNSFVSQNTNEPAEPKPRSPSPSHAQVEAQSEEEGPTLQDAREAVFVDPVDVDLLEEVDEDERDEAFDVSLNRHLKQLINTEKKSKQPNLKRLVELTMLSDYNNLRKSYINAGSKSPSVLASNRVAEAKFVPTPAKPVYQHESWMARRLRVKAYHLVRFGSLPESNQGKGATHYSILLEQLAQ
ncbi:unnamed protein product [Rhizoctonia solani]|uniref:Homeobox domain-containing protein n=1 Tax=Rhizoctonia solani TaxID=456999 RepID=A0A8H3GGY6_9AGAM|nr:unnamed protein product [Rhizoctonia solani]